MEIVKQLRLAHEKAREARRLLGVEQREIGALINYARSENNLAAIKSLSERKRALPELHKIAGEREREAYGEYIRAGTTDPEKAEMTIRLWRP